MINIKSSSVSIRCLALFVLLSLSFFSCTKLQKIRNGGHRCIDIMNTSKYDLLIDYRYIYDRLVELNYQHWKDSIIRYYPDQPNQLVRKNTKSHGPFFLDYWNIYEDIFDDTDVIWVYIFRVEDLPSKEDFYLLPSEERIEVLNSRCCRYDLTLDNLNSLDWIISFPPGERMDCVNIFYPDYYLENIYGDIFSD